MNELSQDEPVGHTAQYHTLARALGLALQIAEDELSRVEANGHGLWAASLQIEARFVTIVTLSAALCESMGNTILATLLDPVAFKAIERKPPVEKWIVHIPRATATPKLIPSALSTELDELFDVRNSIMHPQATVFSKTKTVHEGNSSKWNCLEQPTKVRSFASIPVRLADLFTHKLHSEIYAIAHGVRDHHLIKALNHEPKVFHLSQ